mmetsp:Transcript_1487/g.9094  ORF Transcript_1487/g.9094 Transcript_1487/m.9094 type:complete len:341 (-) Transcript_1487:1018-2040(-)
MPGLAIGNEVVEEIMGKCNIEEPIYNLPALGHFARVAAAVGQDFKHGEVMASSSSRGGGSWPKIIRQLMSSKLGFIVNGIPSSSVKNVCMGALHIFTHIPVQLLSSKKRHFSTTTVDLTVPPKAGTSSSSIVEGPTSHSNIDTVIFAFTSAPHLVSGNNLRNNGGILGKPNNTDCFCCSAVFPLDNSLATSTIPTYESSSVHLLLDCHLAHLPNVSLQPAMNARSIQLSLCTRFPSLVSTCAVRLALLAPLLPSTAPFLSFHFPLAPRFVLVHPRDVPRRPSIAKVDRSSQVHTSVSDPSRVNFRIYPDAFQAPGASGTLADWCRRKWRHPTRPGMDSSA